MLSETSPVLVFMACVALATYAQNLTGFAFSLILLGLVSVFHIASVSDTANAVLMFEKYGLSARLAWNWRDEFLSAANQGGSRNPRFTEAYQQFDLSVGYDFNDHLSVTFEAINLTGEDIRIHGRSELQLFRLEDQFARYAIGARYKF